MLYIVTWDGKFSDNDSHKVGLIKICFFYSLYCIELFDGAEGNLIAILEQYPPIGVAYTNLPLKKRIFSQFLHLIGVWFLQKSPIKDVDQVCIL